MPRPPKKARGIYWRKNADGQIDWYYRIYLDGCEQRKGPFRTKTDAQDKRNQLKSAHQEGKVDPKGGWKRFEAVLDRHLEMKAAKKDQASQRKFAQWWKERARAKGVKRVKDLTPHFLEEARDDLKRERINQGPTPRSGKHRDRKPSVGKLAEAVGKYREGSTLNRYFRWLHSALKSVRQSRRLLFDDWEWEPERKGRTRHLSPQEETVLLAALGPYANMARLAILTGLRQAEQFTLQWKDVDVEGGLLTLPTTKADEVQYVHLSEEAKTILRGLESWSRSRWVFPSEGAGPLDARNFYHRVWIPAVKRVGIEWARWHDLRHTFASRAAMKGQNESTIAALLRHSGTGLVKRYAHLNQPHLKQAVEAVSKFGRPLPPTLTGETGSRTGKKQERAGEGDERTGQAESAEAGDRKGKKVGAPDTN